MQDYLRSFSWPGPAPDPELLHLIVTEAGRAGVRRLLRTKPDAVAAMPGLGELLDDWVDTAGDVFWHPAIGCLKAAAAADGAGVLPAWLLQLGCIAQLDGAVGTWSFDLAQPSRIWIDRWLSAPVIRGKFSADDAQLQADLEMPDGVVTRVLLERQSGAGDWRGRATPDSTLALPEIDLGTRGRILLVPEDVADPELLPTYEGAQFQTGNELPPFAVTVRRTLALVEKFAPNYLDWIAGVARYLAPVKVPGDLIGSCSTPMHSGVIALAADARLMAVAEMLVHEASHQYFFIAACLGEIDNGSKPQLFYSRFARAHRPISRILVAYHALANIALFYRQYVAAGLDDDGSCAERLAGMVEHVDEYQETLESAGDALTALGLTLWHPLAQKFAEGR